MKTLIFGLAAILCTGAFAATDLPAEVVFEHTTHVGFAPPEFRGTFRFQLLKDGALQMVNNKNEKTIVGSVSSDIVKRFQAKIQSIVNSDLKPPQTPPCYDAPTSIITVQKENGEDLEVWRRSGCRDSVAVDQAAVNVAEAVKAFQGAYKGLDYWLADRQ